MKSEILRLGIMGGSFNPIHNGHINAARIFTDKLNLDKLFLIPVASPPHKSAANIIEGGQRLEMCRIASQNDEKIEASDIEIKRAGPSYTVETLKELHKRYPKAELFLIMGSDMFLTVNGWRNFGEISTLATLCGCARNEGELSKLESCKKVLESEYNAGCCVINIPVTELSSTEIREKIGRGEEVSSLLPVGVFEYIKKYSLYSENPSKEAEDCMAETFDDKIDYFKSILKAKLTDKRFRHTCNVSDEAVKLAKKYGADVEKARFAGLVHDIMKDTPRDEQLRTIEKYSIILDNVEAAAPKLLHAISGAAVLKYEHNITDTDVLNAVRYHTTARAGMSLLEKIIYLADYISADRDYEGVDELRAKIYTSLQEGLDEALSYSITEQIEKKGPIHIDTVRARNELILSK